MLSTKAAASVPVKRKRWDQGPSENQPRRPLCDLTLGAMAAARFGPRFPKSVLHEFFQVHGGTPTFSVEDGPPPPASPRFTCNLVIPAVQTPQGGFSEMHFTAFARSKKGAEHAAAEKALDFIMSMGLLQPPAKTSVVPFLAPSAGSDISLEEVRQLQSKLRTLSMQIACGEKPPDALLNGGVEDIACMPQPVEDVDHLTEEELRRELRKAQEVNAQLRKELSAEHTRRKAAMDALLGTGPE